MAQVNERERPILTEHRPENDLLPDFPDDLGPARSPLLEMRDFDYFLPDDEHIVAAPPPPVVLDAPPPARVARHDAVLAGPALVLVLLFFGCCGVALVATGLLLGGIAGMALAGIGGLIALTLGAATWRAFVARSGQLA